jgi:hypothetical protein
MYRLSMYAIVALVALLGIPGAALACNIAFRTIGPVKVKAAELKRPTERATPRATWKLDDAWVGTVPELNQIVRLRGTGALEGVAFARQRALSIDAAAPTDNGWLYRDDALESTPPCAVSGLGEWQPPVILVRETRREVTVTAASQRTPGSREGCVLGGDGEARGCPTLTRTIIRLARPIGTRRLVFETLQ